MRRSVQTEFPLPPVGKTGWPWGRESPPLPDMMPNGKPWPKISIVTPSYNQGSFIEETIRSVLLQGYPNLEYIVIDGGSNDGSVDVIRKYERWLMYWVSEPDRGQAHAISKGFSLITGTLLGWINSDDSYLPGALLTVAASHSLNPHALIAGGVVNFDEDLRSEHIIHQRNLSLRALLQLWKRSYSWHQPGIFFPRSAYESVGGIDISLRYAMDHDLMYRLLQLNLPVIYLDDCLSRFRLHSSSKTRAENTRMALEIYSTSARYWHLLGGPYAYYGLRMLLHLTQRSMKYLVRGAFVDARDSFTGGVHLFANVLQNRQRKPG